MNAEEIMSTSDGLGGEPLGGSTETTEITVERATDIPGHEYGRRQLRNFVGRYDDGCMGAMRVRGRWEYDVFVAESISVYDTELESWGEWVRIDRDGAIVREAA